MTKQEQIEQREAADQQQRAVKAASKAKAQEQGQTPQKKYEGQHQCAHGGQGRVITRE